MTGSSCHVNRPRSLIAPHAILTLDLSPTCSTFNRMDTTSICLLLLFVTAYPLCLCLCSSLGMIIIMPYALPIFIYPVHIEILSLLHSIDTKEPANDRHCGSMVCYCSLQLARCRCRDVRFKNRCCCRGPAAGSLLACSQRLDGRRTDYISYELLFLV